MRGYVARPSTANTMCLVLKPKQQEEYTHNAPLLGSESEREAWRKNRVMQMKLGAYLAEVQLQQQSCARLLKTEEYRFTQEANRRSSVPRSVEMLQQLHFYRQKHFPRARYTYDSSPPRDRHHLHHHHHHGIHKHPPLSARLVRSARQPNGFNRPKTSATIYRKAIDLDPAHDDVLDGPVDFDDETSTYTALANEERQQIFDLAESFQLQRAKIPQQTRRGTATELPAINAKDNFENVFPQAEPYTGRHSTPRKPSMSVDSNRKVLSDNKSFVNMPRSPFTSTKQRTESIPSSSSKHPPSLQRLNSTSKFISPDLLMQSPGKCVDADRELVDTANADVTALPIIPGEEDRTASNDADANASEANRGANETILTGNADSQAVHELDSPDIPDIPDGDDVIDFVDIDGPETEVMNPLEDLNKEQPKPIPRKTSFNRIRTEPVMPLRHNITSVLRQERARYEANQLKVKDYIHKMGSRDTISRSNPRELSAQSRKSSARMNDSRTDSKVIKKNSDLRR